MSHSFNKIWVHAIFSTKERKPLISLEKEHIIYERIERQLVEAGCPVKAINGMPDHVHLLFLLNAQKAIVDVLKQVKGNTSHWINEQDLIKEKFLWQTGYAAYSVSESQLEKVYKYILDQKEHHKKKSFSEEYEDFVKLHGLTM